LDHGSQRSTRNAGQKRPCGLRVCMPKASAREFHQSNRPRLVNALLVLRKHSRVLHHRRAFADCFGANPVASALGSNARRDPSAADRTYHGWSQRPLKTGTFYFARKRNFLLCLDKKCFDGCTVRQHLVRRSSESAQLLDQLLIDGRGSRNMPAPELRRPCAGNQQPRRPGKPPLPPQARASSKATAAPMLWAKNAYRRSRYGSIASASSHESGHGLERRLCNPRFPSG
jgi:hypothetical protein